MIERPILFAPSMALATVEDLKTQTRRLTKFQPSHHWQGLPGYVAHVEFLDSANGNLYVRFRHSIPQNPHSDYGAWQRCPYGRPGDRLWGREAHRFVVGFDNRPPRDVSEGTPVRYECDGVDLIPGVGPAGGGWTWGKYRPPMFMPRWASRILLEITEVRVQRLHEISEEDAIAEGVQWLDHPPACAGQQPARGWRGYENNQPLYRDSARDSFRSLWVSINGIDSWDANPCVWAVSFKKVQS